MFAFCYSEVATLGRIEAHTGGWHSPLRVALPFIVRALVLVGGRVFSGHLGAALPITGVDGLGEGTEFVEGVGFADVGDLVLDAGWKSTIHLSAEGGIAPLDMGG